MLGQGQVMPAGMDGAGGEAAAMPQQAAETGKQGSDPTRDAFQSYASTGANTAAERARNVTAARS